MATRVLLVDPARHLTHFLRRVLERRGYAVREAHSARAAREQVVAFEPRIVILELELEDEPGTELCRALRDGPGGEGLVLVFVTAHAYTAGDGLRAAGADWYFPKPISPPYLLDKLAELTGDAPAEGPRPMSCARALALTPDEAAALVHQRDTLCDELESSFETLASVQRVHWNQGSGLDARRALRTIVDELTAGRPTRRAAFWTVEGDVFEPHTYSHAAPAAFPRDAGPLAGAAANGRGAVYDGARFRWADALGPADAFAVVPLVLKDEVLGCLGVWSTAYEDLGGAFLGRLVTFAHQAAMSLRSGRLHAERLRARRIRQELSLAGRIQESLLQSQPSVAGERVAAAAVASACREVGGDFYEIVEHGPDVLDVIVGDVMGKGLPAAVFASAVKTELFRAMALVRPDDDGAPDPVAVLTALNARLARELARFGAFVTLAWGRFDLERGELCLIDAGHTFPLHASVADGAVRALEHDPQGLTNLPLGVHADCTFVPLCVPFADGDAFLFYSDGVIEASVRAQPYGLEALTELVRRHAGGTAEALAQAVRDDVRGFLGGAPLQDDLTCVAVRVERRAALTLPAQTGSLERLRAFVADALARLDHEDASWADEERRAAVQLAVIEGVTNVIRHAFAEGDAGELRVEAEEAAGGVRFRIHDRGRPFDPASVPPAPLGTTAPGGYGVHLMRELADELRYERTADGENRLTLSFGSRSPDRP